MSEREIEFELPTNPVSLKNKVSLKNPVSLKNKVSLKNPVSLKNQVSLSPYSIYMSEMHSIVKKENPNMSTMQIISHIGDKWRKEEDEKSEIYALCLIEASLI
jgi:hypothetical protein